MNLNTTGSNDFPYPEVRVGDLVRVIHTDTYDLDNRRFHGKVGFVIRVNAHWVGVSMCPDLDLPASAPRDHIEIVWQRPDFDEFDTGQSFISGNTP